MITNSGAAELLGITPAAVSNYGHRSAAGRLEPTFPRPWLKIGKVVLFVRAEVEVWAAERAAHELERAQSKVERLERELAAAQSAVPVK